MTDIYIDRESVTTPQKYGQYGSPDVVAFGRPILSYVHFDPDTRLTDDRPDRPPWMPEFSYRPHGWVLYIPPGVLKQCPEDVEGLSPEQVAYVYDDWMDCGGTDYEYWEWCTEVLDADAVDEAHRVALAYLGKYSKPPTLKGV